MDFISIFQRSVAKDFPTPGIFESSFMACCFVITIIPLEILKKVQTNYFRYLENEQL